MKSLKKACFYILLSITLLNLVMSNAYPQISDSLVGSWISYDDDTNQPAAIVLITEKNGFFNGVITKVLDPNSATTCDKCSNARKGKPLLGMEILSGLKRNGDLYSGGLILDPDDGETYRAEMRLKDQGSKVELRAYIGIPLLGRTQTWIREK